MLKASQPAQPVLRIGNLEIEVPVVLAPMAGITNTAYRMLCRSYGSGLYVSEMITSRALVERTPNTMRLIKHHPEEKPRSIQLYGVDPITVGQAVRILVEEDRADHIDLNFGCPVPKVTRKGGGAALPWKRDLFQAIVRTAVQEAHHIPVTVKMRKGIDRDHLTYMDAGKIAEDSGVAAVTLHGRTQNEHYSGHADWEAIAALKQHLTSIPVLGNGDIWSAEDAIRMVEQTGCDGVVVGRGCLGRPWLFADLEQAFRAKQAGMELSEVSGWKQMPKLGQVMDAVLLHVKFLVDFFDGDEAHACRDIRKHMAWYFKGYGVGGDIRRQLAAVTSIEHMKEIFAQLPRGMEYPGAVAEGPRGRAGGAKRPHLPEGWLDSQSCEGIDFSELALAERDDSGG